MEKKNSRRYRMMKRMTAAVMAVLMAVLTMIPVWAGGIAVSSIRLNKKTWTIPAGSRGALTASVYPSNASDKTLTWTTSDLNVATVKGGVVTAKGPGTATIAAKSKNGKVAFCRVTVKKEIPVKSVSLSRSSLTLTEGGTAKLKTVINPSNTTDDILIWSTSNPSAAVVSADGVVTAVKAGSTVISFQAGDKKATCKVTVKAKTVAASSVKMSPSSLTLAVGSTASVSATVYPVNATNRSVTWSSSNSSVVTVRSGKITAKKAGTAKITARTSNGKTAVCTVKVTAAKTGSGSYLNVSEAYTLLNRFRTTRSNQWYWNSANTGKITTYGLKSLKRDTALEKTAKIRAKEQWEQYYVNKKVTHTRPNGLSCWTVYPSNVRDKGENLAWGQTSCRIVILDGSQGWAETNYGYSGQGHRRNMLNRKFTKVGIACYTKNGETCWAMCLGS